jgi:hypothetical protein
MDSIIAPPTSVFLNRWWKTSRDALSSAETLVADTGATLVELAVSTRIAVPPDPYSYDPEELFVGADAALYAAKTVRQRAEG